MNNLAFQIYGLKKTGIFQSVWKTDNIALGGELANIAARSLPTDWSGTNLLTGGYTHNGSGLSELLFSIGSAALQNYQIVCTLSAGSTGSVVIGLGNVSSAPLSNSSTTIMLTPTAGSGTLKITAVDFVGTVSLSVKASSSATNQIKLPLPNSGTYNIWVNWGDGTYDNITSYNSIKTLHTYPAPGEYTVKITGDRFSFGFGPTSSVNDRLKIKSISSWGKLKIGSNSFNSCHNLTMSGITDIPDLTGVNSLSSTFNSCSKITTVGRMNEWNTSSITNMTSVFNGCVLFNQCIGGWNVSNVTIFEGMFYNCLEFNNGDNSTPLNNWRFSTTSSVSLNYSFILCKKFNRYIGDWNTSNVTIMADMFNSCTVFNNGFAAGVGTGNQLKWDTSSCTNMSRMFISAPAFNSNLGTGITTWDVSKVTTFAGMFQGASNFNNGDEADITKSKINNWNIGGGITGTITLESMFQSASAFNRDISGWDVSKVNTLSGIFAYAINFNNGLDTNINPVTLRSGLDGWNIVVTGNMYGVFLGASNFNRPLSNWNTTNVTWMLRMFNQATSFNQDISKWNVGKVISHSEMFSSATAFNNGSNLDTNTVTGLQGINGWNINTTAASVDMSSMFRSTSVFNREVSSWNVSKVTLMNNMFNVATAFNNGLAVGLPGTLAWNTIGVTTMRQMFDSATAFNCNVGGFNVSSCIDFGYMFRGASSGSIISRFNNGGSASIADWTLKTTGGIAMDAMFNNAIVFNQPIGSWNVSRVYTMFRMFGNSRFNQPIENWDVSNVNDMASMFEGDILFNQDLSKWNVGKVTTFASMFNNAAAFNNGLNTNTNLVTGLIGINGWNINTTAASVDMSYMFSSASAFNREVSSWNVSKVTSASNMFFSAIAFNQPLANWERVGSTVGNMTNMSAMFQNASAFNQNIGNWNVSKVTTFVQMFQGSGFNNGGSPDINNWAINTTLGTNVNMSSMFSTTGSFNQPIGSWNVSNVTNFSNFMFGKTNLNFSATNLDAIYNGWIVNGVTPNLTNVNFGSAKYTSAGATGRAILTNPVGYNWTIIDGGQI